MASKMNAQQIQIDALRTQIWIKCMQVGVVPDLLTKQLRGPLRVQILDQIQIALGANPRDQYWGLFKFMELVS